MYQHGATNGLLLLFSAFTWLKRYIISVKLAIELIILKFWFEKGVCLNPLNPLSLRL